MRYTKVPYMNRRKFCRKVKETEEKIHWLQQNGGWILASKLKFRLRNCWWGYKRYL